jgi:hypothetical protein
LPAPGCRPESKAGAPGEVEHGEAQRARHRRQHLRRRILKSAFEFGQILRGNASAGSDIGDALAAIDTFGSQLLSDHLTP